jgi:MscS family membrane protein
LQPVLANAAGGSYSARPMKPRFSSATALKLVMTLLVAVLLSCVWTEALAQAAAATTNGVTTNAPANFGTTARQLNQFIESHKSELSFGLDRIPALQFPLLGTPLWQYLASLIYVVLAFYVSKFIDWLIKSRLKRWAEKTTTRWDDVLVGLADGPVKAICFVALFHVGLQVFDWPTWLEDNLSKLTLVVVAVSLVLVLLRAVDAVLLVWRGNLKADGDRAFNEQFLLLMGKLFKAGLIVVAILTLLSNFGVNITAILGSVSVLGLALGLAAQDTVANLFGAVSVFVDKPFRVGDRIRVGSEVDGVVEEMGLRATRVRSLDGFLITVPNKAVGNNTVTNITRRPTIRTILNYGITYDTPTPRVRRATEILREIFTTHPQTQEVNVAFNRYDASSLNLEVIHICKTTDWPEYRTALEELNLSVKERFDAEGLEFAFPTQTVVHKNAPPSGAEGDDGD